MRIFGSTNKRLVPQKRAVNRFDSAVGVRALRGIFLSRSLAFQYLDLESHRQLLGWIAGSVVTGLIFQESVNGVLGGQYVVQWPHRNPNFKVPAVNAQLVIRGKWKAAVLACRIRDSSNHDVGGRIQLQFRLFQIILLGLVGIDVEAARDPKLQLHRARASAVDVGQSGRSHAHPGFASLKVLRPRRNRHQQNEARAEYSVRHFVATCWPRAFSMFASISERLTSPKACSITFPLRLM